jgi:hypothetical protein
MHQIQVTALARMIAAQETVGKANYAEIGRRLGLSRARVSTLAKEAQASVGNPV